MENTEFIEIKNESQQYLKKLANLNCDQCGYTTSYKQHLKTHVDMVHLKLRPFECSYCNSKFGTKSDQKRHIKNVHEKAYVCQQCNRNCSSQNNLNNHMKDFHEKELNTPHFKID